MCVCIFVKLSCIIFKMNMRFALQLLNGSTFNDKNAFACVLILLCVFQVITFFQLMN